MKQLFTVLLTLGFAFFGLTESASAQQKIGYVSIDELIGSMPEAAAADSMLQDYQSSLQEQGDKYLSELKEKDSLFVKDSATLSPAKKELRSQELFELYQKVQGWNQVIQQKMNEKKQQLIVPIQTKAMDAIKAVAKDKGYTYVLDEATLIVSPPGDNILEAVKAKLGIKAPAAEKPKKVAAPAGN